MDVFRIGSICLPPTDLKKHIRLNEKGYVCMMEWSGFSQAHASTV